MMHRVALALLLAIAIPAAANAQIDAKPDPSLTPEEVIGLQLEGLQRNDIDGIAQVWAFAHPDNKRFTGPLERFALMMTAPNYRILLGHRSSEIRPLQVESDVAIYEVTVTGAEGGVVIYRWGLRKVAEGDDTGSWMTVTVSPPLGMGNEI